ncbi:hypothetical protein EV368DRAFT_64029 [Lentinula lateritia]|nr:hypothetical protein EV368DRAFT_64029 [Lentinula lateritia]
MAKSKPPKRLQFFGKHDTWKLCVFGLCQALSNSLHKQNEVEEFGMEELQEAMRDSDLIRVNDLLATVLVHSGSPGPRKDPNLQLNLSTYLLRSLMTSQALQDLMISPSQSTTQPWPPLFALASVQPSLHPAFESLEQILFRCFDVLLLHGTTSAPHLPGAQIKIPTFENHVFVETLHLSDSCFAATLLAVCSIGSRHSNNPRVLTNVSQLRSAGWKYFKQIRLSRASFIQPVSLFEVQLYALSTISMQLSPVGEATSSLVGIGIWFAQEVGAHKRHLPGKTLKKRLNANSGSVHIGCRPRATTEKDLNHICSIELEFLIECDDEYWMNESDPESSFVQPPETPSYVE